MRHLPGILAILALAAAGSAPAQTLGAIQPGYPAPPTADIGAVAVSGPVAESYGPVLVTPNTPTLPQTYATYSTTGVPTGRAVSNDGSLTGGNMTRSNGFTSPGRAAAAVNSQIAAASGVTGELSGSYRAGVGGVGGLADVGPSASFGAVAGQALSGGGGGGTAVGTEGGTAVAAAPPAEAAPPFSATYTPPQTSAEEAYAPRQQMQAAAPPAAPAGNLRYTATYTRTRQTAPLPAAPVRARRTLEK